MLEKADLSLSLSKSKYREAVPVLRSRLLQLQRACRKADVASLIVIEGWGKSGKGSVIDKLTQRLEPRGITLHSTRSPRTYEKPLPWMRRFWVGLPSWGEMAIYNSSWYRRVLRERVEAEIEEASWSRAYNDINRFEKTLADDRYIITKFFLHIDKREQKRRLKSLESDPMEAWRVREGDWDRHRRYDEYLIAVEEMLEKTESVNAPWTIVEAVDQNWARVKIMSKVVSCLEAGLESRGIDVTLPAAKDSPEEKEVEADHA